MHKAVDILDYCEYSFFVGFAMMTVTIIMTSWKQVQKGATLICEGCEKDTACIYTACSSDISR